MPNLKDLKTRIGSVKSTQKITKAMKMVAASKLRRAQERAEEARPYSEKMERMLVTLAGNTSPENAPALLAGRRDAAGKKVDGTHALVVVSSDRGLCGGFNGSLIKETRRLIKEISQKGRKVKLILFGKKAWELLKGEHEDLVIARHLNNKKQPDYADADVICEAVLGAFEKGEIDSCSVVYNKFLSALVQKVTRQSLIPLEMPDNDNVPAGGGDGLYLFEPDEERILAELLPRNLSVQCYAALLESAASEHGARMTAMDNATRNAGEMIRSLTLVYNRTRQAAITKELIEIISGAEAL